jgi:hypothetical protein
MVSGATALERSTNGWTASSTITAVDPDAGGEIWPDPMPDCLGDGDQPRGSGSKSP